MQYQGAKGTVLDELQFFDVPNTERGVVRNELIEYRTLGEISQTSPFDFRICPQENQYLDLHRSRLKVKLKVVTASDTPTTTENASVDNNAMHMLFRQVDIMLNQVLISSSNNNYPFKAAIDCILNTQQYEDLSGNPSSEAWGFYPETNIGDWTDSYSKSRLKARTQNGKSPTFTGPLLADACSTRRWILPGVETVIRLWQTDYQFRILKDAAVIPDYKVVIEDIAFIANLITVKPEVTLSHQQILQTQTAKYPYKRTRVHTYNIKAGASSFKEDQIFQNDVPDKVYVTLVPTTAYLGLQTESAIDFSIGLTNDPLNLNFIKTVDFTYDDVSLPGQPWELDLQQTNRKPNYYDAMFAAYDNDGKSALLTNQNVGCFQPSFIEKTGIFCFNPYKGEQLPEFTVKEKRKGNARLSIVFEASLAANLTVIIYGVFNDMFEINKDKNIIIH
jgi:hypothetical protein